MYVTIRRIMAAPYGMLGKLIRRVIKLLKKK